MGWLSDNFDPSNKKAWDISEALFPTKGGSSGPSGSSSMDQLAERYRSDKAGETDFSKILTGTASAQQATYNLFKDIMGRPPTQGELDEYSMTGGGASGISAAVQALKHTPSEDLKRKNQELLADAPKHYDEIKGQFQSILGRDPTQQELDHFGGVMASGTVDAYQLQDFLKNLPENVTRQDAAFRQSLTGELQKGDSQYYNEQVMPGIASNFAKQGRSFDSSPYAQALAQAAQGQNRQRESFLANLTAQQYGGNQANAYAQYANNMGNYQNTMYQSALAPYGKLSELSDYKVQQDAYANYLQRYGKRSGNMGGYGQLAGMAIGGALAAPTGGMSIPAGMALGGYGGQATGNLWDSYSQNA